MSKLQNVPQLRFEEFSGEWENTNIKSISTKVTDGTHDTPKPIEVGIPYLTAIHVKDGFLDFDNCYYLSVEDHNKIYNRCNPEYGDLLLVNIGAGSATTAMVKVDFEFSLKNVALIKPNKAIINAKFLFQVQHMNAKRLNHQLTSGGAQPFLSLKEIAKIKLSIPQKQEQEKIASFLSSVDTKIEQLTSKAKLLQEYKRGVMQKIFSQEMRFKNDDGSDYPEWVERKLGDIFKINAGGDISKENVSSNKNSIFKYPIYSNSEKNNGLYGYSDFYKIEDDCLTVTGRGTLGIAIARAKNFVPIVRLLVLIGKSKVNYKFYENAINNLRFFIESTGVPQLTGPQISSYKVAYPSYEEQTKIANFLSSIDSKIEQTQKQLDSTREFKKALLQQMFV